MKNVIFDFGRVLVDWEPEQIVECFTRDKLLQIQLLEQLFYHQHWSYLDSGKLSEQALIDIIANRLALPVEEVGRFFTCIKQSLIPIPRTVELLEQCQRAGLGVYGLSNICEEFYTYLYQRYAFFGWFDGVIISATEKLIKPDPDIYTLLLQRFNLSAQDTLFIDDRAENTQAAMALGIETVTFDQSVEAYRRISHLLALQ